MNSTYQQARQTLQSVLARPEFHPKRPHPSIWQRIWSHIKDFLRQYVHIHVSNWRFVEWLAASVLFAFLFFKKEMFPIRIAVSSHQAQLVLEQPLPAQWIAAINTFAARRKRLSREAAEDNAEKIWQGLSESAFIRFEAMDGATQEETQPRLRRKVIVSALLDLHRAMEKSRKG